MSNSITRVIKAVTSINSNVLGFSEAASNPKTFPKVALAVVVSSSVLGFGLLQIVDRKREVRRTSIVGQCILHIEILCNMRYSTVNYHW